ncbi:hypothetical protein [uncultured Amphritea sp.]|uniref:hypothetical protein n=1 Tax=uncultured Amphritea sp. TaxID=981605 RepID=UPI002601E85D|nr:hypothetical protein [uncultured Amphritea sp.]
MFVTYSLEDARMQLQDAANKRRLHQWTKEHPDSFAPIVFPFECVRFPVGVFFIRGDRAGPGKTLAEQVVASFGYWNDDSGKYFDMVFPGWAKDGELIHFDRDAFLSFRREIEAMSKYRYSGQTDILLLNYDYPVGGEIGDFSLDEAIVLPVEEMVRDGRISNLDALMHELICDAKDMFQQESSNVIWDISDKRAVEGGRKALLKLIKQKFLKDLVKVYDELKPFAVCDLRLPK